MRTDGARSGADSARRAIRVLFGFEREPVTTVRQLAKMVDIPLPTAHRYVALLRDMGIVEEVRRGEYRLTMRVAALAGAARQAASFLGTVEPYMVSLRNETQETVLLIQPVAGLPVCAHRIESEHRLRLSFEVGQQLPALRGASARLMIGARPAEERRACVEMHMRNGAHPPTVAIDDFLSRAAHDAARGWAVSSDEVDEGVWSAGAMLWQEGNFQGTLSVPCPTSRVDTAKKDAIIAALRRTADLVNSSLGRTAETS